MPPKQNPPSHVSATAIRILTAGSGGSNGMAHPLRYESLEFTLPKSAAIPARAKSPGCHGMAAGAPLMDGLLRRMGRLDEGA